MRALAVKADKQKRVKVSQIYGDYLIMLAAPCIVAWRYYGARALLVIAVSVLTAELCDLLACLALGRKFLLKDLSNIFIGAAIALMMPSGIPLYVPASAAAFAVLAAKIPFGGSLKAPFVPAAAGFAFASVCFKELVFDYSYNSSGKLLGARSLGALLANGNSVHLNALNTFDILSGNVAGPMGTGCGILMLGCCAYLFVRRRNALLSTAGFIAACAVFSMIFPRINASPLTSAVLELSSGSLLFAAVFLLTDYSSQPVGGVFKIISGALCGIFCMIMRYVGVYEETVCFAVLLTNGISPVLGSAMAKNPLHAKKAVQKNSAPSQAENK